MVAMALPGYNPETCDSESEEKAFKGNMWKCVCP